jgi:hypothetical protein
MQVFTASLFIAMYKPALFQKRKIPFWAADVVALLGLAVYIAQSIYFAYNTVSNLDEGAYLLKGYLFATGKYSPFDPGISMGKAPLAFLIPGYVQLLFGPGLRTGRYLAVFFGVMAVIGTWVAARRLGGKWLAAGAVWTLALSPVVIKYYSGASTQSTVACLLAWMLALALGEKRSFWELTLAGFLAGVMMMVRQNMLPVFPLLIAYAFWQHGKKAWGLTAAGVFVTAFFFFLYWPLILQLWTWLPFINIPAEFRYTGSWNPVRWMPQVSLHSRFLSFFQAFRFNFIPLAGSLISILFIAKINKWKSRADVNAAIFLFLLFFGLLYMHFTASIVMRYCVFCFSPYIAFFNVAGILLVVVLVKSWEDKPRALSLILLVLIFLIVAAGIGFSAFEQIGGTLVNLPAPRIREMRIMPGFVTWRELLSNGFHLGLNESMRFVSAAFGFLVGLLTLLVGYIIWRWRWRAVSTFGMFFAGMTLLLGVVFSPVLHGRVNDCDTDVIAANEQVGEYLGEIIPDGSLVYWHGGLSAAPLLYLPDVKIFPPQINAGYTFLSGSDTAEAYKFGYWNEEMDEKWKATADFFIIEDQYYPAWKEFFDPDQFDEFPRSPVGTSCLPESHVRIFRRNK